MDEQLIFVDKYTFFFDKNKIIKSSYVFISLPSNSFFSVKFFFDKFGTFQ